MARLTPDVDLRKKNESIYVRRDDQEKKKKEFDNVYYRNHDLEEIVDMKHLEGDAREIVAEQMTFKEQVMHKVKEFEGSEIYGRLDLEMGAMDKEKAAELEASIWKKVFDFAEDKVYYLNSLTNQKFEERPVGLQEEDDQMEKVVIGPQNVARVIKDEWEEVPVYRPEGREEARAEEQGGDQDLYLREKEVLKPLTSKECGPSLIGR